MEDWIAGFLFLLITSIVSTYGAIKLKEKSKALSVALWIVSVILFINFGGVILMGIMSVILTNSY